MIRLSRTALAAAALLALAAGTGAAQSIPSPIRYIEQKQGLQPFAGYVFSNPSLDLSDSVSVDIGIRPAPIFGLGYQLRLSGPLSLQASVGYIAGQRDVFLAEASADSGTITPIATNRRVNAGVLLADAGFLFHLTGRAPTAASRRSWASRAAWRGRSRGATRRAPRCPSPSVFTSRLVCGCGQRRDRRVRCAAALLARGAQRPALAPLRPGGLPDTQPDRQGGGLEERVFGTDRGGAALLNGPATGRVRLMLGDFGTFDFSTMTDDEIYDFVVQNLGEYPELDMGWIEVAVHNGHVTLSGRVSSDAEIQIAEKALVDVMGLDETSLTNDLMVDELHRGENPEAADDAVAADLEVDDQLGEQRQDQSDTAAHLLENLDAQTYGTHDVGTAIEDGASYEPPDRPVADGIAARRITDERGRRNRCMSAPVRGCVTASLPE